MFSASTLARCAMMAGCFPTASLLAQSMPLPQVTAVAISSNALASPSLASINSRNPLSDSTMLQERRGSLLLCGGNLLPTSILDTFYARGGESKGRLVIIPTASPRSELRDYARWLQMWEAHAWQSVEIVDVANRDGAFQTTSLDAIRNATAVWVSGGDQQRLVDRYLDTPVHTELLNVLHRGGIVGGTSAGAAIVSRTMIAEGLTQPVLKQGWGLLPGVIIDQHFTQRNRFARLSHAIQSHPDQVGVGIDESTGLLMDAQGIQVLGEGAVHVHKAYGVATPDIEVTQIASGQSIPGDSWNRLIHWTEKAK